MDPWELELLSGWAVIAATLGAEGVRRWRRLADDAKKLTVYQSPDFVMTWYELFEREYEPLLLLGRGRDGVPVGILPLAVPRSEKGGLVFAGADFGAYAGWLAAPALEEEFPTACLTRLHELGRLPAVWAWPSLAPGTGVDWLRHPALAGRITARLIGVPSRVWRLPRPGAEGRDSVDERGGPSLVRLDGPGLTEELFARFQGLWDSEQLMRHAVAPFDESPSRAAFVRRLLERAPDRAALFALMAGSVPVAFALALVNGRHAACPIAAFDPRWRAASPEIALLERLAAALRKRGVEEVRLAAHTAERADARAGAETLCAVHLYRSRVRARLQERTASLARYVRASPAGIRVGNGLAWARGLWGAVHQRPLPKLVSAALRGARGWLWSRDMVTIHRCDCTAGFADKPGEKPPSAFREDTIEDFLHYTGSIWHASRQAMMTEARRRLGRGEHCVTALVDGVLAYYAWVQVEPPTIEVPEVGFSYRLPPQSAVAYDSYTEPRLRGHGLHRWGDRYRVRWAARLGARQIFSAVADSNVPSKRAKEAAGYRPFTHVVRVRRLGRSRTWEEPLASAPAREATGAPDADPSARAGSSLDARARERA